MTRDEAEAVIPVFLAALREAGYPVDDDFAFVQVRKGDPQRWVLCWFDDVPDEVGYRAASIAKAVVGEPSACLWCWKNAEPVPGPNPCVLGDCRAPIEESV